jgi:hypothetical protein
MYVFICCFLFYHTDVLNCHSDLWSAFSCLKCLPLWRMWNEVQVKVIYVILSVEQLFVAHWLLDVPPGLTVNNPTFCLYIVYVFCMDLRTNSDYFTIQHWLSFFFVIKPTRCTNFTNLLWHETLHVSDSSSVHHQEFIHCKLSSGICRAGL